MVPALQISGFHNPEVRYMNCDIKTPSLMDWQLQRQRAPYFSNVYPSMTVSPNWLLLLSFIIKILFEFLISPGMCSCGVHFALLM